MAHTTCENIRVVVRFRPLNEREMKLVEAGSDKRDDFNLSVDTMQNVIDISRVNRGHPEKHQFIYDHVFDEHIGS